MHIRYFPKVSYIETSIEHTYVPELEEMHRNNCTHPRTHYTRNHIDTPVSHAKNATCSVTFAVCRSGVMVSRGEATEAL